MLSLEMLTLPLTFSSFICWPLIGHSILASDWLPVIQFAQELAGAPVDRHNAPGLLVLVTQDLMKLRHLLVSVT